MKHTYIAWCSLSMWTLALPGRAQEARPPRVLLARAEHHVYEPIYCAIGIPNESESPVVALEAGLHLRVQRQDGKQKWNVLPPEEPQLFARREEHYPFRRLRISARSEGWVQRVLWDTRVICVPGKYRVQAEEVLDNERKRAGPWTEFEVRSHDGNESLFAKRDGPAWKTYYLLMGSDPVGFSHIDIGGPFSLSGDVLSAMITKASPVLVCLARIARAQRDVREATRESGAARKPYIERALVELAACDVSGAKGPTGGVAAYILTMRAQLLANVGRRGESLKVCDDALRRFPACQQSRRLQTLKDDLSLRK